MPLAQNKAVPSRVSPFLRALRRLRFPCARSVLHASIQAKHTNAVSMRSQVWATRGDAPSLRCVKGEVQVAGSARLGKGDEPVGTMVETFAAPLTYIGCPT